eukprot:maker-scaffold466_size163480-snap-gene-0.17 protein:Tk10358 transcript:maker-scaffold466_size163480-snap-gene-0.17-mRNA-1 annotation:"hypothetical protein L798_04829"
MRWNTNSHCIADLAQDQPTAQPAELFTTRHVPVEVALDYNLTVVDGRYRITRSPYSAIIESLAEELGVEYEAVLIAPRTRDQVTPSENPNDVVDLFAHVTDMLKNKFGEGKHCGHPNGFDNFSPLAFWLGADVGRILFASWWLFIQVITSFYTAELTAVLTLSQQELPVKNMEDLRYRHGAKWVAIDGAEMTILQKDHYFQYLSDEITDGKGSLVNSVNEALERVLAEDDTFYLTDTALAEKHVLNDLKAQYEEDQGLAQSRGCRLSFVDGFHFGNLPYGLMVRKRNHLLNDKLNGIIDQLSSSGILEYLANEQKSLSDLRTVCSLDDDKTLIVQDLISTFLLVVLGYGISTLMFTFELLFPRCTKRGRQVQNEQMYPADRGIQKQKISQSVCCPHPPPCMVFNVLVRVMGAAIHPTLPSPLPAVARSPFVALSPLVAICSASPALCRPTCRVLPALCRVLPAICRVLPALCRVLPALCRVLPALCSASPALCRPTCRVLPATCRGMPTSAVFFRPLLPVPSAVFGRPRLPPPVEG